MSIELNNLTKKYGGQIAVNGISLNLEKGQILGFLGPNGAGKSTTMKMITGYLQPDAGSAKVCGMDVASNPIEVKQKIGYLPESNPLYHEMYVKEYLGFIGGIHKIPNIKSQISKCIKDVGLTVEQHKKIGQLSKGYKQRVGLAAAILHNPEVLILDEPTGGLDPNQLMEIRELIKELGKEKTVILSTHIMQEVEAMCDRVAIISKGNLVANDTLANLKKGTTRKKLKIGFEESLEQEWLKRLPAVETLEKTNDGYWLLEGEDLETLRKQVLQLAAEQNLNISSLQTTGGSLEDIFRSLTT
ncbi:MAG: gliding motility-associated ABC transporter ATP-binding subunit GldA [Chitinophagaceae bacterium]|jgi:ABC-2 type transport system ATP-binding protein|nr:gliding motility-associated ABC transporter ATP-binding subunit GldA [Chitinophagaceae bacterium]